MARLINLIFSVCLMLLTSLNASAETLVININTTDPTPKAAFEKLIEKFKTEHPLVEVEFKAFDQEGFTTAIRNFLTSEPPDVVAWFAGERMRTFISDDLFEDISDLWQQEELTDSMSSSLATLTVAGRQYGIPYSYHHWGVYYRKDLFERYGLNVPKTWQEFLQLAKTLNDNDIKPLAIGTKFLSTTATWFDYLNIRVNGLDFHRQLMSGQAAYDDARVRKTFAHWQQLIDAGFYIDNHAAYSVPEAQEVLYQGNAAMSLTSHAIVPAPPEDIAAQIDYFQFPLINADVALYESAPTNTLHIPGKAKNKDDARKFLAFVARADNQTELNQALDSLPPNKNAEVSDNRFLKAGFQILNEAPGLIQFYERDTNAEMAKIGMQGFQEFMLRPDRLDKILDRLEKNRKRIFNQ